MASATTNLIVYFSKIDHLEFSTLVHVCMCFFLRCSHTFRDLRNQGDCLTRQSSVVRGTKFSMGDLFYNLFFTNSLYYCLIPNASMVGLVFNFHRSNLFFLPSALNDRGIYFAEECSLVF